MTVSFDETLRVDGKFYSIDRRTVCTLTTDNFSLFLINFQRYLSYSTESSSPSSSAKIKWENITYGFAIDDFSSKLLGFENHIVILCSCVRFKACTKLIGQQFVTQMLTSR